MPTPNLNDPPLSELLSKMNASSKPFYVPVKTAPGTIIDECVDNVNKMIHINAGQIVLGWQFWKTKHLLEAEFHAIWENPERQLVDVSPKEFPDLQILFLKDHNLQLNGMQIDNYRLNFTKNALADDLITLSKARFEFLNRGKRAYQKELKLTIEEEQNFKYIMGLISMVNVVLEADGSHDSLCLCGSNRKIKECHLKDLPVILSNI
jgi:hypothetical protein